MSFAGGHSSIISCVRVGKHPNTRSKNLASAQVFCCECGLICLRVRSNSLICDVNLIIFGGKLIKLRRKFNNLRRKLKNFYARAAKLLRTCNKTSIYAQQNFNACAAFSAYRPPHLIIYIRQQTSSPRNRPKPHGMQKKAETLGRMKWISYLCTTSTNQKYIHKPTT